MERTMKFFIKLVVLLLSLTLITACSEEESGGSTSPSTGDPVDTTPVGEVEATGFWVNAQNTQHTIYVNNSTGYGTDCFIDAESTTNELMTCYIDVLEGDLYMYDVTLQYNAPPALCDHVSVTPAWHWNNSSGTGPSAVTVNIDSTGAAPVLTSCTATHDNLGAVACNTHPELTDTGNLSGPSCIYDKSGSNGQNCCLGDYTLTLNDTTASGLVTTVSDSTWGGSVANCIGGLPRIDWAYTTDAGYPISYIQAVPKDANDATVGLNASIKLPANTSGPATNFSYVSNYYTLVATPHNHDGYYSATTSNFPYAVAPIDDLDGSSVVSGSDAYVFTCLDSAFEVKHQIRTYIREWNTLTDFLAYNTSSGATYNPDVVGVEGTNCAYDVTFGDSCNDFTDFADILTSAGGTYTTTPGPGDAATRETFFPRAGY